MHAAEVSLRHAEQAALTSFPKIQSEILLQRLFLDNPGMMLQAIHPADS
jgi:hypothetical protein